MKQAILTSFILFTCIVSISAQANRKDCNCPKNTTVGTVEGNKPDSLFNFSDKHRIILCGGKYYQEGKTYFSEFLLQVCGRDSVIDIWDATQTCRVFMNKNMLNIVEIKSLPVGVNRTNASIDWSTTKIYFSKGQIKRTYSINHAIKKYNKQEIRLTLREFEAAKLDPGVHSMEELAYRLFVASISGSKKAKQYFEDFGSVFGELDGSMLEDYKNLRSMLLSYEYGK